MYGSVIIILNLFLLIECESLLPPTCDSRIYCQGDLLRNVQLSRIYNDSKTFVDMRMLHEENYILDQFAQLLLENNGTLSKSQIEQFVGAHFAVGDELEVWVAPDYKENPKFLERIRHDKVRKFAKSLIHIWPQLTRKIKDVVLDNSKSYSIIPLKNGFVIPGGRFRETYYWDTFWIIKGLLISEMPDTVRGILDNFIAQIEKFGFIPNGGRIYYTRRSQPPLFTPMVMQYIKHTKNYQWLKENINSLDKELSYWLKHKTVPVKVNNKTYKLARYKPESSGPRSESYREDYNVAEQFVGLEQQQNVYTALKGAAESGWDFSTRWFYSNGDAAAVVNLTNINTTRSIPVDLNSYIYKACTDLHSLYRNLGMLKEAVKWREHAVRYKEAIRDVFWNQKEGIWFDYDLASGTQRKKFYLSNVTPLWAGAYSNNPQLEKKVIAYLERNGVFNFNGGVPTSLDYSGEQWDFPNAWPPLQSILVGGLARMHSQKGKDYAKLMAKRWIEANMIGFNETGEMFEKYDAMHPGAYGGGGEYTVQSGFGWTNGVALEFIDLYYTN